MGVHLQMFTDVRWVGFHPLFLFFRHWLRRIGAILNFCTQHNATSVVMLNVVKVNVVALTTSILYLFSHNCSPQYGRISALTGKNGECFKILKPFFNVITLGPKLKRFFVTWHDS